MKTIPLPLLQYLLSTDVESGYVADMFNVLLKSGQQLLATNGQLPIRYAGLTYDPSLFGAWKIDRITTKLGVTGSTCEFTLDADPTTLILPFDIPILEAVQMGLFDAATVIIYRMYSWTYGDTSLGVELKFGGQISEFIKNGRTTAQGTIAGYTFALNKQMPSNVLHADCRWNLYDPNTCTVSRATFTYAGIAAPGTNNVTIVLQSPITPQPGITLVQGVIKFTSGRNNGLSMSIQAYDGSANIRITRPMFFPIAPGDTFVCYAGCAHDFVACRALQTTDGKNPFINFGGTPYIPNQEASI